MNLMLLHSCGTAVTHSLRNNFFKNKRWVDSWVSFARGVVTKCYDFVVQQKCTVSQFWRPEVLNHNVSRAGSFSGLKKDLFLASLLGL